MLFDIFQNFKQKNRPKTCILANINLTLVIHIKEMNMKELMCYKSEYECNMMHNQ